MKVLRFCGYAFAIIVTAWCLLSYIDIIADNCSPNPVHHMWNFFSMLTGWKV